MIPSRANQILEKLYETNPEIVFKWINETWPLLDSSPCILLASLKTDPTKSATLHFSTGISEHTVEEHVDGIKNHLIFQLK
jgi:hypothetical protein